jgi:hypothetical protein
MGETAIPFILAKMAIRDEFFFWALFKITGDDPVSDEDRGHVVKMTQAWLKWGEEKGYIDHE